MKKAIILTAVLSLSLFAVSCKKARTCTCTTSDSSVTTQTQGGVSVTSNPNVSSNTDAITIDNKISKKDALRKYGCFSRNTVETTVSSGGSGSNAYTQNTTDTRTTTCDLK